MDVVILCGGQGARMREETEYRPKPMVEVGGLIKDCFDNKLVLSLRTSAHVRTVEGVGVVRFQSFAHGPYIAGQI